MGYVDPATVSAPKEFWKLTRVLADTGQGNTGQDGWSVAEGTWEGDACLAIRWNGVDGEPGVGSPQSRGYPTWFIVPKVMEDAIRREVQILAKILRVVSCKIERPSGFDYGAWQICVTLSAEVLPQFGDILTFSMPTLEKRLVIPGDGYRKAVNGEIVACFKNGLWVGEVYSNGVHEDENPTPVSLVRDAFTQAVVQALRGVWELGG